jgi:hypothetical protein
LAGDSGTDCIGCPFRGELPDPLLLPGVARLLFLAIASAVVFLFARHSLRSSPSTSASSGRLARNGSRPGTEFEVTCDRAFVASMSDINISASSFMMTESCGAEFGDTSVGFLERAEAFICW